MKKRIILTKSRNNFYCLLVSLPTIESGSEMFLIASLAEIYKI